MRALQYLIPVSKLGTPCPDLADTSGEGSGRLPAREEGFKTVQGLRLWMPQGPLCTVIITDTFWYGQMFPESTLTWL